jgi:hypothetical protein
MKHEDAEIQKIAIRQHGAISWEQVQQLGMCRGQVWRRVRSGEWVRALRDVWRLSWAESTWMQKVWCASLRGGSEALISHQSAAWLWELDGVRLETVDLSAPYRLESSAAWFAPHRVALIPRQMRRTRRGIALTSPSRTLVDLAGVLERGALQQLMEQAFRRKIVSAAELRRVLQLVPARGKAGTGTVASMLEAGIWHEEAQSELERQAMRLFREFGLPRPEREFPVIEQNRRLAVVDFAWPRAKVIVEAEGFQFHSGRQAWESDIARYNSLALRGWTVLRLTRDHLREGSEAFARSLSSAVARNPGARGARPEFFKVQPGST